MLLKTMIFTLYRIILLLACMDVELNPGPSSANVNSLDIFHLNTPSIRNKIDYLSDIVDLYQILCFSKTHLEPNRYILLEDFDSQYVKTEHTTVGVS